MLLEDEADPPVAERGQLRLGQREGVLAVQGDPSAAGRKERAEDAQQRALARPARPDDRQVLSAGHRQGEMAEHDQRPAAGGKLLAQVFNHELRHRNAIVPRP